MFSIGFEVDVGSWGVEVAEISVGSILLRLRILESSRAPTVNFENVGKAKTNMKNHTYLTRLSKN